MSILKAGLQLMQSVNFMNQYFRTDPLRSVIYGVSECVGTMVTTLVDQNAKLLEQVEQLTRTLNSINEEVSV